VVNELNRRLAGLDRLAPVVLRVAVGGIMVYHGFDKFRGGIGGVEEFFAMAGVPAPGLTAALVAALEVVAGAALIVGIATRLAAASLAVVLVGAIAFVKAEVGVIAATGAMPGFELDVALLAGLVALIFLGPGPAAVDHVVGLEEPEPATVA
jgi:putative oxidoreductase